jgi:hypothetical protein
MMFYLLIGVEQNKKKNGGICSKKYVREAMGFYEVELSF